MNLIDRYVEAAKRYLPARIRDDIGKELHSLLEEKLDAAAERAGGKLSEDDIARLLKEQGHPYEVALAYYPNRALVSERAYPLYRRVLATTLAIYFLVAVALALVRLERHDVAWGLVLVPQFLQGAGDALLFGFFIITVTFHCFGDALAQREFFWRWDPKKLPEIGENWANIPLPSSFVSIVGAVLSLAILSVAPGYAAQTFDIRIEPGAFSYLLPLRLLLLGFLALSTVNLWQRYWTRTKLVVGAILGLGIAGCLLGIVIQPAIVHIVLTTAAPDPGTAGRADAWPAYIINLNARIIFGIFVLKLLYDSARGLFRAVRKKVPLI